MCGDRQQKGSVTVSIGCTIKFFIKMKAIVGFLNISPLANRQICQLCQQLWENGEMYAVGHTE